MCWCACASACWGRAGVQPVPLPQPAPRSESPPALCVRVRVCVRVRACVCVCVCVAPVTPWPRLPPLSEGMCRIQSPSGRVAPRSGRWTGCPGSECPLLVWRRVSGPRDNGWAAQLLSLPGRDFWLPASWASGPECSASVQWCLGVGLCSLLGSFCREIPPPPLPSLSP